MKSNDRRLYKRIIAILLVVLLILPQGISSIVAKAAEIEGLSVSMGTITKNTSTGNYNAAATITLAEGSDIDLSTAGYNATFYKGSAGSGTAITEAVSVNSENVTAQIKNDATISVDDTVYVVISDGTNESVSATAQAGVTFPEPTPEIDTTKPVEVSGNSITVYSDIQGTLNSCKIIKVSEDNSETVINGSINIEFDSSCKATITCDLSGYANENYKIKVTNSDGSKAAISALIRNNYVLKIVGDGFVVLDSNNNVIPNNTVITSSTTKNVTVKTTSEATPLFSSLKTKIGDGDAQDVEATPSTTELSSSASVTLPNVGDFSEFTISGSVKPAEVKSITLNVGSSLSFYPGYKYNYDIDIEMTPIMASSEGIDIDVASNNEKVTVNADNTFTVAKDAFNDGDNTKNVFTLTATYGELSDSKDCSIIENEFGIELYDSDNNLITTTVDGNTIWAENNISRIKIIRDKEKYGEYYNGSDWVAFTEGDIKGDNYEVTFDAPEADAEGNYSIVVRAYKSSAGGYVDNSSGNYDMVKCVKTVKVDNTAPVIELLNNEDGNIDYKPDEHKNVSIGIRSYNDINDIISSNTIGANSRTIKIFGEVDYKDSEHNALGSGIKGIYYHIKDANHSEDDSIKTTDDLVKLNEKTKELTFNSPQADTTYVLYAFDNVGNVGRREVTVKAFKKLEISDANVPRSIVDGIYYIKAGESVSFVVNGMLSADGDTYICSTSIKKEEKSYNFTVSKKDAEDGIGNQWTYSFSPSEEGTYTLSISAKDPSIGEPDTKTITVIYDATAPTIAYNELLNKSYINAKDCDAQYLNTGIEVTDDNLDVITVNNVEYKGKEGNTDENLKNALKESLKNNNGYNAKEGYYKISFIAKDKAGNETPFSKEFTFDKTKPTGSITNISADSKKKEYSDYQYFDNKTIKVSLKLSDSIAGISNIEVRQANVTIPSTISKTTTNKNGDYEKTAEFSIPVTYKGYLNVLITDKAGNTSTVKLNAKDFAGVIAENGSASNSISISATKIESKFDNGTQYYNKEDSPKVSFDALDEISGIYGVVLYGDGDTQKQKLNSKDGYYVKDKPIVTKDSDSWSFSTSANEEKEYTLKAVLEDNSENYIKSNEVKAIVDNIAPEISITYNGSSTPAETYNSDVNVVVTVKETYFKDGEVTIHDGSSTKTYNNFVSNGNGTATCSITLSDDSNDKYWVSAVARDMALNETKEDFTSQFILDKTSPRLTLTFNNNDVRNEKYYNAERIGTLTVEEHNFDASKVTVNVSVTDSAEGVGTPAVGGFSTSGDTHQASIPFTGDATYQITVTAEDQAGNAADQTITESFVVDLTDPEINISNVEEDKLYSGTVNPDIEVTDRNYDSGGTKITLVSSRNNGAAGKDLEDSYTASSIADGERFSYSNFKKEEDNDDYYVIKAVAEDLAGNTSEETIGFMVNRFGSYFTLNDYTSGIVDAIYTNLEGDEDIEIAAHNLADIDESTVYFTVGEDTQTLKENDGYTVSTKTGDDHWNVSTYTFDKSLFETEGEYNIVVSTKDSEGNVADNESKETPVKFVIDRTAPEYVINGVEDGQNYEDVDSVSGNIELHDNIGVAKAVVTIDGTASEYEGKDLDDMNYSIPVDFEKGSHTVKVKVYDVAGNESVDDNGISFSVNQNALERNLWWIIALIVAALAVGLIIFFVVKGRRDEKA